MFDNILEPSDKTTGRHWRVICVVDLPLQTEDDYLRMESSDALWLRNDHERCHYSEVMDSVKQTLRREVESYLHLRKQTPAVTYILQVRRWGKWHTVVNLKSTIDFLVRDHKIARNHSTH